MESRLVKLGVGIVSEFFIRDYRFLIRIKLNLASSYKCNPIHALKSDCSQLIGIKDRVKAVFWT